MVYLREAALDSLPFPQIVLDVNGLVTFINEKARIELGLSVHDIGKPFQDLEISYRPVDLRSLVERSLSERRPLQLREVAWTIELQSPRFIDVKSIPLLGNGESQMGVSLIIQDVTDHKILQEKLENTNQELETAMEELQSTNEELETTNEELQSTIEELETTNEELQSTNEELETMNEELQSTNQEMGTINEELQIRNMAFDQVNIYLESILGVYVPE